MGGGGFGQGGQSTRSNSNQFIDFQQRPFLNKLRNRALNLQTNQQGGLNQFAANEIPQLFQTGQGFNQQLGNLSQLAQNDPVQQQNLDALSNFSNRDALQGQIGNLGENIGQFFNEQLLPGIDQTTQLAGQGIGSGRNSVARGQATRDSLNAFARGAADLEAQFGQQQISAAQGALAGRQGQLGLAGDLNQAGFNQLSGLGALGLSQFTAPFANLQNLNAIIGPPTVLGDTSSKGIQFDHRADFQIGNIFGG